MELSQKRDSEGPPPGVNAKSMRMLHDAEAETVIFITSYESAEDMAAADRVFSAMDPTGTPGTRASVDCGEVIIDRTAD